MHKKIAALLILMILSFHPEAISDVVHLKNGNSLEGYIIEESSESITLQLNEGTVSFSASEISHIEKTTSGSKMRLQRIQYRLTRTISKWWSQITNRITWFRKDVEKTMAEWMKPLEKTEATKMREKRAEDSLKQMGETLKKVHKTEKEAFKLQQKALGGGY